MLPRRRGWTGTVASVSPTYRSSTFATRGERWSASFPVRRDVTALDSRPVVLALPFAVAAARTRVRPEFDFAIGLVSPVWDLDVPDYPRGARSGLGRKYAE